MQILYKSFMENPDNATYDGEDADEKTLYVMRKSFITNISWIFQVLGMTALPTVLTAVMFILPKTGFESVLKPSLVLVLTLFWYLITFGYFLQNFVNWFFNVYIITSKKIIDMDFQGLLYKNISEAPLRNIEDVTSTISGTANTIFNYGSVFIQTSAEKSEFEFEDVDNPSRVRDIISDLVTDIKTNDHH